MRQYLVFFLILFAYSGLCQVDNSEYRKYNLEYINELILECSDPDTLAAAYYHRSRKLFLVSNDDCLASFSEALPIIKSLGQDSVYYAAKLFSVLPLVNSSKFKDAHIAIQECEQYYKSRDDLFRLASVYITNGYLQKELLNDGEAVALYHKALDIYNENDFPNKHYGINNVNNRIGIVYSRLGQLDLAISYFDKVRSYSKEHEVSYFYRAATSNLAGCMIEKGFAEGAVPYIEETIRLRKPNRSNTSKRAIYIELSELAVIQEDLESAIMYLDSSIYYSEIINNHIFLVENYFGISKLYSRKKDLPNERRYLLKAEKEAITYNVKNLLPDIYRALGINLDQQNQSKKAAFYYGKHFEISDSLDRIEVIRALQKRESADEIQRYNREIENIRSAAVVKSLELEKQKERNQFLLLFSGTILGLLVLLFYNLRSKRKDQIKLASQNKEIEANLNDKEILLKEIHHRVKNNLQVVSSMLNLNLRYVIDPAAKEILLESRNRVKSMALIHQKLYQEDHLKGVGLKLYLESLVNNLVHSYRNNDIDVKIKYDVQDVILDVDTLIPVGLIANEIISNSLKHAFVGRKKGNIMITSYIEEDQLYLEIRDDGLGIIKESKLNNQNSFGMTLIDSLSQKLKAEVSFQSNEGTIVSLKIKKFATYNSDHE